MNRANPLRLAFPLALALFFSSLARPHAAQETSAQETPARAEIEKLIKDSGADVSVAYRSLDGPQELFILADQPFEDRNALRLPIMFELYAQADARALKLTDTVSALGPSGAASGPSTTLHDLCEDMIVNNSDPATNRLIERLGIANIRQRINSLGATGMSIGAPFPKNQDNHTTVRALLIMLWSLASDQVVSPDTSKEMLDLLARSPLHASPSLNPNVATSKAADPTVVHDAEIITGAHSFVFVIQIRGLADPSAGAAVLAKITHALSSAM